MPDPAPSLAAILRVLADFGCTEAYFKILAANDNAKNQPYMGQSYEVLHLLPHGELTTDGEGKRTRVKASLKLSWVSDELKAAPAPHAKLILYPQYPEVRLSGFLLGCSTGPSRYMKARDQSGYISVRRIIVFGVNAATQNVFCYLAVEGTSAHRELESRLEEFDEIGVFREITGLLPTIHRDTRSDLLNRLAEIARLEWIISKRLDRRGNIISCLAPNCGGYTLEAELGIIPNGRSDPDYLGWEIKQHAVGTFANIGALLARRGSAITLMTPEPTAGAYVERGVECFVRTYGYADRTGRPDRINFGGKYVLGKPYHLNGVRLEMEGFDASRNKFDPTGSIRLIRGDEQTVAAEWKFVDLLKHWMRKHAKAAYVPSLMRKDPALSYRYSRTIRLGEGTDFLKLLHAIQEGVVYYDPGIKLENASSNPSIKRRSQFRILSGDIPRLYSRMEVVSA
jgi:hypothetical protein